MGAGGEGRDYRGLEGPANRLLCTEGSPYFSFWAQGLGVWDQGLGVRIACSGFGGWGLRVGGYASVFRGDWSGGACKPHQVLRAVFL